MIAQSVLGLAYPEHEPKIEIMQQEMLFNPFDKKIQKLQEEAQQRPLCKMCSCVIIID